MNTPSDSTKDTVLIVDDNTRSLGVIVNYLEAFSIDTLIASNGEAALKRARYASPDIILLDILMPGIDGFETCRRLKSEEETKEIPVIFMTALTDTEHMIKGFSAGAVDYITKPVQQEELLARVTTHLENRKFREHLKEEVRKRTIDLEKRTLELEMANKQLKEAYDIIIKSPAVAFLWKNEDGWPVEFVSPNVQGIFGYTAGEFMSGKVTYSTIVHPEDLNQVLGEVASYSNEKGRLHFTHKSYRIVAKEGEVKWIDDKTYIRRDGENGITHYQGIVEDITDQIIAREEKAILEKQLQKAQKMEALGTLSGGIAHDFNNILFPIIGFTEMVMEDLSKDSMAQGKLKEI